MKLLQKLDKEKLSQKCRKYAYFLFIIGILLLLNDVVCMIISFLAPWTENSLTAENLPVIVVYAVLNLLMVIISIPAFLTIKESCKTIYEMLLRVQEV